MTYALKKMEIIPNDYKFLLCASILTIILLIFNLFSTSTFKNEETSLIEVFLKGLFRIIPLLTNLFILLLFFYNFIHHE